MDRIDGEQPLVPRKDISYLPPYDAVIQRRQHAVAPLRGFHSQPIPVVRFCALSNPYGYYRRYALLPSWFSRIHLPISLPSARLCFPCLPRFNPQRYYGDSDSCSALPTTQVSPLISPHLPVVPPPTTWAAWSPLTTTPA